MKPRCADLVIRPFSVVFYVFSVRGGLAIMIIAIITSLRVYTSKYSQTRRACSDASLFIYLSGEKMFSFVRVVELRVL